jgi:transcriptional regulator
MYAPPHFAETRPEALLDYIAAHPFGSLVTATVPDDGLHSLDAAHVPVVIDRTRGDHGTLEAHLARANPVAAALLASGPRGIPVLAIFSGPDAYVSPQWYASKHEHGRVVPTWNYVAVHAHGTMRAIDESALRAHLDRLTALHEGEDDYAWRTSDAPSDYIDRLLPLIVGVEIEIARLDGTWKMSQNRPAADIDGVIAGLQWGGPCEHAVAALVESRRPQGKQRERRD